MKRSGKKKEPRGQNEILEWMERSTRRKVESMVKRALQGRVQDIKPIGVPLQRLKPSSRFFTAPVTKERRDWKTLEVEISDNPSDFSVITTEFTSSMFLNDLEVVSARKDFGSWRHSMMCCLFFGRNENTTPVNGEFVPDFILGDGEDQILYEMKTGELQSAREDVARNGVRVIHVFSEGGKVIVTSDFWMREDPFFQDRMPYIIQQLSCWRSINLQASRLSIMGPSDKLGMQEGQVDPGDFERTSRRETLNFQRSESFVDPFTVPYELPVRRMESVLEEVNQGREPFTKPSVSSFPPFTWGSSDSIINRYPVFSPEKTKPIMTFFSKLLRLANEKTMEGVKKWTLRDPESAYEDQKERSREVEEQAFNELITRLSDESLEEHEKANLRVTFSSIVNKSVPETEKGLRFCLTVPKDMVDESPMELRKSTFIAAPVERSQSEPREGKVGKDKEVQELLDESITPSNRENDSIESYIESCGFDLGERDSNEDTLRITSTIVRECAFLFGQEMPFKVCVKKVPESEIWIFARSSGQKVVLHLLFDNTIHKIRESGWILEESGQFSVTYPITITEAKLSVWAVSDGVYRALKRHYRENQMSSTRLLNLTRIILMTQRANDSTVLSKFRYLMMNDVSNTSRSYSPAESFKKATEKLRSRLSCHLSWIYYKRCLKQERERANSFDGVHKVSSQDSWLDGMAINERAFVDMMFLGNLYDKDSGGTKLTQLDVTAKVCKFEIPYQRMKKTGELNKPYQQPSGVGKLLIDWELLSDIIDSAREVCTRDNPAFFYDVMCTYQGLARKYTKSELSTASATMINFSDRIPSHFIVSGQGKKCISRVDSTFQRGSMVEGMLTHGPKWSEFPCFDYTLHNVQTASYVESKKQLFSAREIHVLHTDARIAILAGPELLARSVCSKLPVEMLTKGKFKENKVNATTSKTLIAMEKMLSYGRSSGMHVERVGMRNTSDCSKWCQLFRMSVFKFMFQRFFREVTPSFVDHVCEVLNNHVKKKVVMSKTIMEVLLERKVNSREEINELIKSQNGIGDLLMKPGECTLTMESGMWQGILHYTSSMLHSLIYIYIEKAFREKIDELLSISVGIPPGSMISEDKEIKSAAHRMTKCRWDILVKGFVSSDDSSMICDVILAGPRDWVQETKKAVERKLSELNLSRIGLLERIGIEESEAKSSIGTFNGWMEFNSVFFTKNGVYEPSIKHCFNSQLVTPMSSVKTLCQNWLTAKAAYIKSGGSVGVSKAITAGQMMSHYRLLGHQTQGTFPFLFNDLLKLKHHAFGFFEYERNPDLCGTLNWQMNHASWVISEETTRKTESLMVSDFGSEMGQDLIPTMSSKIHFGNGIKEAVAERKILALLGADDMKQARAILEDGWQKILEKKLDYRTSVVSKVVKGLITDHMIRNRPSNFWKLPILINASTIISASLRSLGLDILYRRMTLPSLISIGLRKNEQMESMTVHDMERAQEFIRKKNREFLDNWNSKDVARALAAGMTPVLSPFISERNTYLENWRKIEGIKILNTERTTRTPGLPASVTREVALLTDFPIDMSSVCLLKWTGRYLSPRNRAIWDNSKNQIPWLRDSIEETLAAAPFFSGKAALAQFVADGVLREIAIQSRSGTTGQDYSSAIEKVLRMQGDLRGQSEVRSPLLTEKQREADALTRLLVNSLVVPGILTLEELTASSTGKTFEDAFIRVMAGSTREDDIRQVMERGISWRESNGSMRLFQNRAGMFWINTDVRTTVSVTSQDPSLLKKMMKVIVNKGIPVVWADAYKPKRGFFVNSDGVIVESGKGLYVHYEGSGRERPVMDEVRCILSQTSRMVLQFNRGDGIWAYMTVPRNEKARTIISDILDQLAPQRSLSKMVLKSIFLGEVIQMDKLASSVMNQETRNKALQIILNTAQWLKEKTKRDKAVTEDELTGRLMELIEEDEPESDEEFDFSEENFGKVDQEEPEEGEDDFGAFDLTELDISSIRRPLRFDDVGEEGSLERNIVDLLEGRVKAIEIPERRSADPDI